jgi:tetratricopeptide (TPR) repeat protein
LRWYAAVAFALIAACNGGRKAAPAARRDDGIGIVPKLPASEDPLKTLRELDAQVAVYRKSPDDTALEIKALLERAGVYGRLDDYEDALARSAAWVARAPTSPDAWKSRVQVLSRVHKFADARAGLAHVDPEDVQELAVTIDEATGHTDRSAPIRAADVRGYTRPANITAYAASLALDGKLDAALAEMPKAAAAVRDNPPELLAYILFQWGRLYEQKGEPAAARELYAAARARLPTLEVTTHLAQMMIATGDSAGAKKLVDGELPTNRNPELLGLAGQLDHDPALVAEAATEWERYVKALPEAFSDHAARFYLGPGANPARAVELAKQNLANRDTLEARALAVEALLAAHDPAGACELAPALAGGGAIRAQRFTAWRAFSACGHTAEAQQLASQLGISQN